MAVISLTETQAAKILRTELGGTWEISAPLGTMEATRIAKRGDQSVVIKLIQMPASIMQRLSELQVTPPVIALGESAGIDYLVQEAVDGPHPDHAWFLANRARWADMISNYLNDPDLTSQLAGRPGFWRLDVRAAVEMINRDLERIPDVDTGKSASAVHHPDFRAALDRWRFQATSLPSPAMRPIHPDPHWHNYVINNGAPLLLDWDYIDLSDPVRDVGYQIWGFLPQAYWAEFLRRVGLQIDDNAAEQVCWWAGFKLLGNAIFNARRGNPGGVESHVAMFLISAANQPWLPIR